jgi:hypothetical protein
MERFVISRGEPFHVGFADIARAANGDLVVIYKQADAHTSHDFTNLVVRRSQDEGRTWSAPVTVVETHDAVASGLIRDPRLICLQDGSLLAAVSTLGPWRAFTRGAPYFQRYTDGARAFLFRSDDHGQTWHSIDIGAKPMICALRELRNGVLLLGATRFSYDRNPAQVSQSQIAYRSEDNGRTWNEAIVVGSHPEHALGEGDFVELDDGTLVCYMRDEIFRGDLPVRTAGSKSLSFDGGQTWEGPYSAGRWLFNGRIACGLLSSGEVMILTRLGMGRASPYFGTFFYEPRRLPEFVGYYQAVSPLMHAYIEPQAQARRPQPRFTAYTDPVTDQARWLVVDEDHNPQPDYGYAGWVNLPHGDVYAVDFLADDAPASHCQIRGYRLSGAELAIPRRAIAFEFQSNSYQPGSLEGQAGWVYHAGPRQAASSVQVDPGRGIVCRATTVLSDQEVMPSLDAHRARAEGVRHAIGPFNLFDEQVAISFEHSGDANWCALQVLDDSREVIAEVQLVEGAPALRAYVPPLWQTLEGPPRANGTPCRTTLRLMPNEVSLSSTLLDGQGASTTWGHATLPDLEVVAGVAIQLAGAGSFALRRLEVEVEPATAKPGSAAGRVD